ncbi:MAG: hypothetical protein QF619_09495 [Candidatus Binatia bacterium]|nr:hypothetical protein [Candidatus Binatia bacterium]
MSEKNDPLTRSVSRLDVEGDDCVIKRRLMPPKTDRPSPRVSALVDEEPAAIEAPQAPMRSDRGERWKTANRDR